MVTGRSPRLKDWLGRLNWDGLVGGEVGGVVTCQ